MIFNKLILEEDIAENKGVLDEELDKLWGNNELALASKIDSYGITISNLLSEVDRLKKLQKEITESLKKAENRVTKTVERIKSRLHYYANEEPLRGSIYSFHPYVSTVGEIVDIDKLSPSEAYLTIEIKEESWNDLTANIKSVPSSRIIKRVGKVTELPKDHPAVSYKLTPTITMRG